MSYLTIRQHFELYQSMASKHFNINHEELKENIVKDLKLK